MVGSGALSGLVSLWHSDAVLLLFARERMIVERLRLALVPAAAAVRDEPQNLLEYLPWDGERFSGAASHCVSKRPIWLGEAAQP